MWGVGINTLILIKIPSGIDNNNDNDVSICIFLARDGPCPSISNSPVPLLLLSMLSLLLVLPLLPVLLLLLVVLLPFAVCFLWSRFRWSKYILSLVNFENIGPPRRWSSWVQPMTMSQMFPKPSIGPAILLLHDIVFLWHLYMPINIGISSCHFIGN